MAESETQAPFALDRVQGWTLHQIAGWGSSTEMDATFARVVGFRPPNAVGATLRRDARLAIRVGPDRLWIVDESGAGTGDIAAALDGSIACAVDLSHGRARLRATGSMALGVMSKSMALDWASVTLAPGRCAQTMLHRVSVLVVREAAAVFDLYVPRTFSYAIADWLRDDEPSSCRT